MVDKKREGKGIPECYKDGKEAAGVSKVRDNGEHGTPMILEKHTSKWESQVQKTINTSKQMAGNALFPSLLI